MSIIDKFLRELNRRIQAVSTDKSDIAKQRNKVLEIENILFNANLNKNNITTETIINLKKNDLERVIELILNRNDKIYLIKLDIYSKIIKSYQNIDSKFDGAKAVTQYLEARTYFDNIVTLLNDFLNNYTSGNTNDLIASTDVSVLNNFAKRFNASGELITPLFKEDMNKLDRIINILSDIDEAESEDDESNRERKLTPKERITLKGKIGRDNIQLVLLPSIQKEEELAKLKKYEVILNKRLKAAYGYANLLKLFITKNEINLDVNISDKQLRLIAVRNPTLTFKEVIDGIIHILLKQELERFDVLLSQKHTKEKRASLLSEIIKNCEQILLLSNKKYPNNNQEVAEFSQETIIQMNEEAEAILEKVQNILKEEEEFLKSIHSDDYSRYAQVLEIIQVKETEKKDDSYDEYRLAMILESLRQELKAFVIIAEKFSASPKEFRSNYENLLIRIKDAIAVYELLRKRRPEQKIKDNVHILYLSDENNEALINKYLENADNNGRKQIIHMINKIANHDFSSSNKLIGKDDYEVYIMNSKSFLLSYAKLSLKDIIILTGDNKTNKSNLEIRRLVKEYQERINLIATQTATAADRQILFETQASIRGILANYADFNSSRKKVA